MNKIALWISMRANNWTAERAIIAGNVEFANWRPETLTILSLQMQFGTAIIVGCFDCCCKHFVKIKLWRPWSHKFPIHFLTFVFGSVYWCCTFSIFLPHFGLYFLKILNDKIYLFQQIRTTTNLESKIFCKIWAYNLLIISQQSYPQQSQLWVRGTEKLSTAFSRAWLVAVKLS